MQTSLNYLQNATTITACAVLSPLRDRKINQLLLTLALEIWVIAFQTPRDTVR